jgi:hypothetical protein
MATTTKKSYNKKPDFNLKSGKLFIQQQQGKSDTESARAIGISPHNVPELENTKNYQAIQKSFKDELLNIITLKDIATALSENITQTDDKNARNTAVKIAIDKVEPDKLQQQAQQVNIVLKSPDNPLKP